MKTSAADAAEPTMAIEAPPKRRGRPPGAKKATVVDKPRKKRRKKRRARAARAIEREWSCFLDEDNELQLCRQDGEGDAIQLNGADALAIAAFVERHRAVLEA